MTADESKLNIHPKAVVCQEATLIGDITIKADTVIQPNVIIRAINGPIIIGERNMIEETTLIENSNEDGAPLIIGDDNYLELGSVIRARSIGSRNVFGIQCVVGSEVKVTDGCSVGVRCSVLKHGDLPERTCIYGAHNQRRIAAQDPISQLSHLEVIRRILPTYHHLINRKRPEESKA